MEGPEAIAAMTLFLSVAAIFIFRGPLGRAFAERIAGRHVEDGAASGELADLTDRMVAELDEVKQRLAEVEERQDFAARMLAQQRAGGPLGPGA